MFGLSFWEIAIILMVALIILGPKKLPELARSLGKGIREFRKATDDFKSTMDYEMNEPDKPRRKLEAQVDDAEILPAVPTVPAEDAAKAALAEEEAKKAVEAAQAEAAPVEAEAAPVEAEAAPVEAAPVEAAPVEVAQAEPAEADAEAEAEPVAVETDSTKAPTPS